MAPAQPSVCTLKLLSPILAGRGCSRRSASLLDRLPLVDVNATMLVCPSISEIVFVHSGDDNRGGRTARKHHCSPLRGGCHTIATIVVDLALAKQRSAKSAVL